MDDIWASGPDTGSAGPGPHHRLDDALEAIAADDPLGDEAAFPSTWQQLEAQRD